MVVGGCSKVEGCQEVIYVYPDNVHGICVTCNSDFFLSNQSCICHQSGYVPVDSHCYSPVVGCLTYQVVSGQTLCEFCNITDNFELVSTGHLCSCKQGYSPVGWSCEETCGDGVVINAECDDGNREDGDGCST